VSGAVIRRRHEFYVEGYDPQGAVGYYDLFRRAFERSRKTWGFGGKLGDLVLDSDLTAHWDIETSGPNWRTVTRYEFLRLEGVIGRNMAEPMRRQLPRALAWAVGDIASGTMLRVFRAAWRFEVHLLYFQVLLLLWLALAAGGGALAGLAASAFGLPRVAAIAIGIGSALLAFRLLRPLADRLQVVQINNCWPYVREFARGEVSAFDAPIDAYAALIAAAAHAAEDDEIVVVGHSAAGVTATAVMARALELDPDLGKHGPSMVLLTLGSVMPAAALHPSAGRMREVVRRLVAEPAITWIDCVSRKDVMNFWDYDLVAGLEIEASPQRCVPLIWRVSFKDAVSPEYYRRLRLSFFRLHYQFIMSGNRRAAYDYAMLVGGPVSVIDWAQHADAVVRAFAADAAFTPLVQGEGSAGRSASALAARARTGA
jgi:hypothetical protein